MNKRDPVYWIGEVWHIADMKLTHTQALAWPCSMIFKVMHLETALIVRRLDARSVPTRSISLEQLVSFHYRPFRNAECKLNVPSIAYFRITAENT